MVTTVSALEGYGCTMEVLGTIIGKENFGTVEIVRSRVTGIGKAMDLVHRIGLLPEAKWMKLIRTW